MRPKVILFGDSITEESFANGGWGAALAHHFSRTADVVLRGYSGYNTRWALKVVARAMDGVCADGDRPLALTVFFGANDASIPDRSSGFQHVPLDEYRSNLRSMVSFFKERWPTTVIVLITPPPIDEDGRLSGIALPNSSIPFRFHWIRGIISHPFGAHAFSNVESYQCCSQQVSLIGIRAPGVCCETKSNHVAFGKVSWRLCRNPFGADSSGLPERTNDSAGAYAKACIAVATESNIPVIDIWSKMQQFSGWEKSFLSDGLHFTTSGNNILFKEMVEKFKETGLSLDTLPVDLPLFCEIDPKDPLKAFEK